ncbi:MAG: efflux RND transporter periplasmic adaptor subunit [Deltaproteobacteria bacterium]|nr:efflux RND transporter periplasmic adaptor subunit [Deltaproteobacteria bacterium]
MGEFLLEKILFRRKRVAGCIFCLLLGSILPAWAVEYPSVLKWDRRVELSTPVSGIVSEVAVHEGERVRKGQLLLQLDDRPFRLEIDRARSVVKRLVVVLDEARREKDRAEELYARTVLSDHELQLARIGWTIADAKLESAKSDLARAKLDLEYSTVRAPFDGRILERHAEVGQTLVQRFRSTPLIVLAASDRMCAQALMTQEQFSNVTPGQKVMVKVEGHLYPGTVRSIGLTPVSAEVPGALYPVDIVFRIDPVITFRAGQPATILFSGDSL